MSLEKIVSHIGSLATLLLTFSLAHAQAQVAVTCNLPATAQVNVAYSGSCTATGGASPYTYAITAGALPGGLSLDPNAGTVTGVPTTAGSNFSFTVTATDHSTPGVTGFIQITNFVVNPVLALTCTLPSAVVNVPYSGSCTASGGTPNYMYSISAGTLPPGLSISGTTGAVTGTPTTAGSAYTFTVQVTDNNATPQSATQPFTNFVVGPALTLTCTLPATAEVGVAYTGASCSAQGGTPAYAYSISAGSLPPGLSINPSTQSLGGKQASQLA